MYKSDTITRRVSQWCYEGMWSVITRWFRVPESPPGLSGADDQNTRSFRPAEGFLRYLKFQFWIVFLVVDIALFIVWLLILFNAHAVVSILLTPVLWALMIIPDILAYIAIHLRYDTTWYVLSDRSMRIRRGIWTIHETTITYENIQNVTVNQGPLQRYFGISDVRVETAGGGSGPHQSAGVGHQGMLEGVDCPEEVRQLILQKWKASKSAGLGDDGDHDNLNHQALISALNNPQQVQLLEQIRDLAVRLAGC